MPVTWSPRLATGIESIDREHRALIDLIAKLDDAIKDGKGNKAVDGALRELTKYTTMHFGHEEVLFAHHGYPAASAHRTAHTAFVEKIAEFELNFARGQLGMAYAIVTFLGEWIERHIRVTDKQYVLYMQSRGVR